MKTVISILLVILSFNCYSQKDTIPVIMLVCDTLSTRPFDSPIPNTTVYTYPPIYWKFGYDVRIKRIDYNYDNNIIYLGKNGDIIKMDNIYWEHLYYLDKNKKPLPKNIVVWQIKETNLEGWLISR